MKETEEEITQLKTEIAQLKNEITNSKKQVQIDIIDVKNIKIKTEITYKLDQLYSDLDKLLRNNNAGQSDNDIMTKLKENKDLLITIKNKINSEIFDGIQNIKTFTEIITNKTSTIDKLKDEINTLADKLDPGVNESINQLFNAAKSLSNLDHTIRRLEKVKSELIDLQKKLEKNEDQLKENQITSINTKNIIIRFLDKIASLITAKKQVDASRRPSRAQDAILKTIKENNKKLIENQITSIDTENRIIGYLTPEVNITIKIEDLKEKINNESNKLFSGDNAGKLTKEQKDIQRKKKEDSINEFFNIIDNKISTINSLKLEISPLADNINNIHPSLLDPLKTSINKLLDTDSAVKENSDMDLDNIIQPLKHKKDELIGINNKINKINKLKDEIASLKIDPNVTDEIIERLLSAANNAVNEKNSVYQLDKIIERLENSKKNFPFVTTLREMKKKIHIRITDLQSEPEKKSIKSRFLTPSSNKIAALESLQVEIDKKLVSINLNATLDQKQIQELITGWEQVDIKDGNDMKKNVLEIINTHRFASCFFHLSKPATARFIESLKKDCGMTGDPKPMTSPK